MFEYEDSGSTRSTDARHDPLSLINELQKPCRECRLGQLTDRNNNGFTYLGPVSARIAVLGDMPDLEGCSLVRRQPIAGSDLDELRGWWKVINNLSAQRREAAQSAEPADIPFEEIFILNTVQCKSMKGKVSKDSLRLPFPEEIDRCFPFRALRVLQSLPQLECVMTLGWTAAAALLGRVPEPKPRSHEGCWFGTALLPGVAVFCLDHLREFQPVGTQKTDPKKIGRLVQHLTYLHNELIDPKTRKVQQLLTLYEARR